MHGQTLGGVVKELKSIFGDELLKTKSNPLLACFTIVVHVCGNEFRNPNTRSKQVWLPDMTPEIEADYAEYVSISQAFNCFIHKGFGSSVCYCPKGTEYKRKEYDQICNNISSH